MIYVQDKELCSRLRTDNIFTCSEDQKKNMLIKYPNETGHQIIEQNKKFEKMIRSKIKKKKGKRKTKNSRGKRRHKKKRKESKEKRKTTRSKEKKQRKKEKRKKSKEKKKTKRSREKKQRSKETKYIHDQVINHSYIIILLTNCIKYDVLIKGDSIRKELLLIIITIQHSLFVINL